MAWYNGIIAVAFLVCVFADPRRCGFESRRHRNVLVYVKKVLVLQSALMDTAQEEI